MAGRAPAQSTLDRVEAAFAAAPAAAVRNPDGRPGITLHAERDETNLPLRPYVDDFFDFFQDKARHFGSAADTTGIPLARALVYRYCIFADTYNNGGSSGIAEGIVGNDFMVTLGSWTHGNDAVVGTADDVPPGGTPEEQAGTFMHELGHTLGLTHGGTDGTTQDHTPFKVNYFSVMNYHWQTPNPYYGPAAWLLDYSRVALPDVNEAAVREADVREADGFGLPPGTTVLIGRSSGAGGPLNLAIVNGSGPVRLNADGDSDDTLALDLNRVGTDIPAGLRVHRGAEDWSRIVYDFRSSPRYGNGAGLDPGRTRRRRSWSSTRIGTTAAPRRGWSPPN